MGGGNGEMSFNILNTLKKFHNLKKIIVFIFMKKIHISKENEI